MAASPADQGPPPIARLRLADFRNYSELALEIGSRFVVLHGDNGSGKTNLLEAVSLLTPGRGLRRATYPDMARAGGSGGFSVRGLLSSPAGEAVDALTLVQPEPGAALQRRLRLDAVPAKSVDDLLGHCRILWLTPAMDGLFTGPAGDRRRFLDRLVLSLDPSHGRRSADYERAMRSRNRLLSEDRRDAAWLGAIETEMAGLGLAIALARVETVERLKALLAARGDAPFPAAGLELSTGYPDLDLARPAGETEDEIAERLARSRPLDRAAGRTLEGPHRGDLVVTHLDKAMPAGLASTGEQKALLIGFVLAHAELVASSCGIAPILLLDEIAAHLDSGRRSALFAILDRLGVQAFMTGTDRNLFEALEGTAQMLTVSNGKVG